MSVAQYDVFDETTTERTKDDYDDFSFYNNVDQD